MRFPRLPVPSSVFRLPPRARATAALSELKERARNSHGGGPKREEAAGGSKTLHACCYSERDEAMSRKTRAWKRDLLALCTSCNQMNITIL